MERIGQIQSTFPGGAAPGPRSTPQGTLLGEHTELCDSTPPTPAAARLEALAKRHHELKRGQTEMEV